MIAHLKLQNHVELCGSLSQADVFSKLRNCDIFALASIVDAEGASDVFPTVIMEAMACARPVVSTRLAGIPESVVEGATGFLVPAGDWEELAGALDKLVRDPALRARLGEAGRARMENEFEIAKTVEPLHQLFAERIASAPRKQKPDVAPEAEGRQTAYLIDQWPDEHLPFLEMELRALRRNAVAHVPFVFAPPLAARMAAKAKDLVMEFEYLPDAMVIEAEWQASMPLVRELEALRAGQAHRPPADLFLQQARYAVMLRRLFQRRKIGHVHATSSRTLLCALYLKRLLGVGISVAIEEKPVLSESVIRDALDQCIGGRSSDRELLARRGGGFLFDQTLERPSVNDIGPWLTRKARVEWTGARSFWREWSQQLIGWTRRA
jgi:hypothetical protein